jgi:hypothetical protein
MDQRSPSNNTEPESGKRRGAARSPFMATKPSTFLALIGVAVFLVTGASLTLPALLAQESRICAGCLLQRNPIAADPVIVQRRIIGRQGGHMVSRPRFSANNLRIPQLSALPRAQFAHYGRCTELLKQDRSNTTSLLGVRPDCIRLDAPIRRAALPDVLFVPPTPHTARLLAELGLPQIEAVPPITILQSHRAYFKPSITTGRSASEGNLP